MHTRRGQLQLVIINFSRVRDAITNTKQTTAQKTIIIAAIVMLRSERKISLNTMQNIQKGLRKSGEKRI